MEATKHDRTFDESHHEAIHISNGPDDMRRESKGCGACVVSVGYHLAHLLVREVATTPLPFVSGTWRQHFTCSAVVSSLPAKLLPHMIRNILRLRKNHLPGYHCPRIFSKETIPAKFKPRFESARVFSEEDATMTRFSLAISLVVFVRQPGLASDSPPHCRDGPGGRLGSEMSDPANPVISR